MAGIVNARGRRIGALVAAVALPSVFVGVVAWTLLRVVPDRSDRSLVPDTLGWRPLSVPLQVAVDARGTRVARLGLRHAAPERVLAYPEIRLLLATLNAEPRLQRGRLTLSGTACTYDTDPGARLADNQYLTFRRGDGCHGVHLPPGGQFDLELAYTGADRVDIWTYVPAPGHTQGPLLELSVPPPETAQLHPVVRGRAIGPGPGSGATRLALLNYLWQFPRRSTFIPLALAVAWLLMVGGALAYPWREVPCWTWTLALRCGAAAAALAAALALLYVVLVPPLHAPDEPDHLLSYAKATSAEGLEQEAQAWARRGHFERIKFHSDEAFRPGDVDHPLDVAWGAHVFAEDVEARSPTTFAIWSRLAPRLSDAHVSRVLLTNRLINACLFALAAGLAALLFARLLDGPYRQVAVVPIFLLPTLPFFAMQMSEFGVLTSVYVLLAACLTVLFLDSPRTHFVGLPLGIACALAVTSGRSAGPMAAVVGMALAGRVLVGSRAEAGHGVLGPTAIFWGGFAAGASTFYVVTNERTRTYLANTAETYAIDWMRPVLVILDHPVTWLLVTVAACAAIEVGLLVVRRRVAWRWPGRALAWMAYGLAVAVLAGLLASLFVAYPSLSPFPADARPNAMDYIAQVLSVMATSLRLSSPDHLLVVSAWIGFGWIDTLPPAWLATFLVVGSGLAGTAYLLYLAKMGDGRRAALVGLLGLGALAALVVYAVSSLAMFRNVHGRYLIGWYLTWLGVAWGWLSQLPSVRRPAVPACVPRTALVLTTCGAVHAWCLIVILQRYF